MQRRWPQFFGMEPCKGVHPDEVVALGAAIQGAALTDEQSEMLLLDVTPHSLGIMIVGGYFHTLIQQNTTVPTQASHMFTTVKDNQTSVKILVLQGESDRAEENELLGEFVLTGLRRAPRGEVEIEVTFEISADGIVSVKRQGSRDRPRAVDHRDRDLGPDRGRDPKMVEETRTTWSRSEGGQEFDKARQPAEKSIEEIESLFPQVTGIIAGCDFGQDAVKKARAVVDRARQGDRARRTSRRSPTRPRRSTAR